MCGARMTGKYKLLVQKLAKFQDSNSRAWKQDGVCLLPQEIPLQTDLVNCQVQGPRERWCLAKDAGSPMGPGVNGTHWGRPGPMERHSES